MAKSTPWAERSGAERRRTFRNFGLIYGIITAVAAAMGWIPIALLFGLGALALGVAWYSTEATAAPEVAERVKPDWLAAMDDPDAPDLTRPEYRTERRPSPDASPFARPEPSPGTGAEGPAPGTPGTERPGSSPGRQPPDPPTPGS